MSKRDVRLYLDDIHESLERIERYAKELSFEDFACDPKTIDAVVRNFEVMGEAAARVPEDFKEQHAFVPWSAMVGMRNKVIHEYFGIDPEIIWKTIQQDIPELKRALGQMKYP